MLRQVITWECFLEVINFSFKSQVLLKFAILRFSSLCTSSGRLLSSIISFSNLTTSCLYSTHSSILALDRSNPIEGGSGCDQNAETFIEFRFKILLQCCWPGQKIQFLSFLQGHWKGKLWRPYVNDSPAKLVEQRLYCVVLDDSCAKRCWE